MTLRIVNDTHEVQVANDLTHIVGPADNGNLGMTAGAPGTTDTVTYAESVHDTVDDRMNALINGFPSNPIVIQGVDSTFVLPDGNVVNQVAGETIVNPTDRNAAGTGLNPGAVVNVVYDVNNCSGHGYFVFDRAGNQIPFPTEVILYHELAHAFHWVNNDFNAAAPEPQAENDENDLRDKESLTERDPNNHFGGCSGGGGAGGGATKSCFIVTAAYGTQHAGPVRAFQRIRDELVRGAPVGDHFFARLMADYYVFSRPLAVTIDAQPALRTPVVAFVVAPLLAHLTVLQSCAERGWDTGCGAIAAPLLDASLTAVIAAGAQPGDVVEGAAALGAIAAAPGFAPPSPAPSVPRTPAETFAFLAARMAGRLRCDSPAAWGLVRALRDAWTALAERAGGGDPLGCGERLVASQRRWLVAAPLAEALSACSDRDAVDGMCALARSAYTCDTMRTGVAHAIVAAAPPLERARITAVLRDAGYGRPEEVCDGR